MTKKRFLSYGKQHIIEDDLDAVEAVLRGDWLTQGETIVKFERALAQYVGAKYAVAVNSGTAALHIAQLAAGMETGKTGLTSALSFVASANAAIYCNAQSALGDIDPNTLSLSPHAVENALTKDRTIQSVTPVHFGGLSADICALRNAAPSAVIIEDACHALGGEDIDGRKVGACSHSDMACFSFHPVKPITTGEGGAVTTNNKELFTRLSQLRNHGIVRDADSFENMPQAIDDDEIAPWYYEQQELGYNYRMTDIQAALGLSQLKRLDAFTQRRRFIAKRYDEAFAGQKNIELVQAAPSQRARSSHHLYVVLFDFDALGLTRTQVMTHLRTQNIGTQVHYIPIYRQPYHQRLLGDVVADFPNTEAYYHQALSLPIFPAMEDEDIERIITCVLDVLTSPGA